MNYLFIYTFLTFTHILLYVQFAHMPYDFKPITINLSTPGYKYTCISIFNCNFVNPF